MSTPSWGSAELAALERETRVPLVRSAIARHHASCDFGGVVRGASAGVVLPRDAKDVERLLSFASRHGLRVTPRGFGLSQCGQSVAPAGALTLDLSRLDVVGEVERDSNGRASVRAGAGARFRDVVHRALESAMLPCAFPLNLDLTVGGVLSVGGFGGTTHAYGPVVTRVESVSVVTGAGKRERGTRTEGKGVLDAVLGGLGRSAIVCEAVLELRDAKPRVTTYQLHYSELASFLRDYRALAYALGRAAPHHLEGFVAASPFAQAAPLFVVHVSYEHELGAAPSEIEVVKGLSPWRVVRGAEMDTAAFVARYDVRFEAMVRSGAWKAAHPWVEAFVPSEELGELIPAALAMLPPAIGDGHRIVLFRGEGLPPLFAAPATNTRELAAFAILPMGIPEGLRGDVLAALGKVDALLRSRGGKRYLSGWLGTMDDVAWRAHYGAAYGLWQETKRRFDPAGVLTSALFD